MLLDSAGHTMRATLTGAAFQGKGRSYPEAYWRYPVPDSLIARVAHAESLEADDDRGHWMRWELGKLRKVPPVCPRDTASGLTR